MTVASGDRQTTTIRVTVAARDLLQTMAQAENRTVGEVIDALLETERRRRYWEQMRVAIERHRADPEAWEEYHAESRMMESASLADVPVEDEW